MPPDDVVMDTAALAAFLHKPMSWIYENAERLGIPRYRVGKHYRYKRSEIETWLDGLRV